ncbi:MAG: hypothetical protein HKN92_00320 [Chitinophagales bacterium]|nr:hypothetical protein [Chitinophagales bacterium]
MKVCILFLAFGLFLTNGVLAGEEISDDKKHEISLNATTFIKDFLTFNNSTVSLLNPYLLNYKYYFGKSAIRTGIGFDFSSSKTSDINDFELKSRIHSIDYRIGMEWKNRLANRWMLFYGFDVIYNRNKSTVITDNGFDVTTDLEMSNGIGTGPVLGIMFLISERIRIYAESSIYYIHADTKDETLFESFPEFDIKNTGSSDDLNLNLPTSVFFAITF